MAEPEKVAPLSQEEVRVKGTFAGQAVDLVAKGATIVLLFAIGGVGYIGLREHHNITSAQKAFINVVNHQNELLHQQTEVLRQGQIQIECQLGILVYNYQFARGQVDWNDLPYTLHGCYPEYIKKLPKRGG